MASSVEFVASAVVDKALVHDMVCVGRSHSLYQSRG